MIGVVAPVSRMSEAAEKVPALAAHRYADRTPEIVFPVAPHGHFAGDDEARGHFSTSPTTGFWRAAVTTHRVVGEAIMGRLTESSRRKAVGYSDAAMLLAALYREASRPSRGPVHPLRDGGDAAIGRALD